MFHPYSMRHLILPLLTLFCAIGMSQSQPDTCIVQEKTIQISTPIRVKAITEKSELINNLLAWQPLATIVDDGILVKKGQILATYNEKELQHQMNSLLLQKQQIETNLAQRLANIDNKNLEMADNMEALQDKLASLESKLARQKSEPTADTIRIVEGRLRIAKMNYDAAEKDYEKAQERFAREMISRAELESREKDLQTKKAKWIFAQQEKEATCNPPARAGQIRSTELEIAIAKLEIEKLEFDIKEQLEISEIQRRGAYVNQERNARQIKERQRDLDHVIVRSPISGVVSMRRPYGNEVLPGMKAWYGLCFMEIPDLQTIAFRGIMPEARRRFHNEKDKVLIRLNGRKGEPIPGIIKQISTLSHDVVEKDEEGMGGKNNLGVKVFDITISLSGPTPAWLLPGIYGEAELLAEQRLTGPVVPIKYVKQLDGKYYISVHGTYQEVSGTRIDSDFLFDNPKMTGTIVQLGGTMQSRNTNTQDEDSRLSASGEIMPVKSTKILVEKIGRGPWCEITWLIPEETMVKKGDVVAKLDTTERDKYVQAAEESATEYRSRKEELEKNLSITQRTGNFNQNVAAHRLESAEINLRQTMNIVAPIPLYKAKMNLELAEINQKYQETKLQRENNKKIPTVSPVELRKMQRELERTQLQTEKARIDLAIEKEGASTIAKSAAQLKLFEAQNNKMASEKQAAYNNMSVKRRYERSNVHLLRAEKRLAQRKDNVAHLTIYAPVDGLICYNKIYSNGVVTKVAPGSTVGQHFNILSIPDMDQMEIKVELDEKYFSGIKEGMEVDVRFASLGEQRLKGIVSKIDLLFTNKVKKDNQIGLYSSHEPLGEVTFRTHVLINTAGLHLKPGLVGEVFFPIDN